MSFTRKHYERAAEIILRGRLYVQNYPRPAGDEYQRGYGQALTRCAEELSAMFAADNPHFDAARFARACAPKGE